MMERLETLLEDVHHSYSICETNNNMETRWMEGYTVGLVIVRSTNLEGWSLVLLVVPNSYSLVNRASGYKVLLDANIHTLDSSRVEWVDKILILGVIRGSLKINIDLHDLIVFSGENNAVISA